MNGKSILIILFAGISAIIFFWIIPYFTQPVGVPLDFFDISNSLNDSNMDIYYIGEDIPFNERVSYNTVESVMDIPQNNAHTLKAIIIDFYEDTIFNETEILKLQSLYKDQCYYVVLLNYKGNELNELIDEDDYEDDLIFLDFTICNEFYFSSTLELHPEINLQNTQYIITHLLERKVD